MSTLLAILASVTLSAAAPPSQGPTLDHLDLLDSLSWLESGPDLAVHRKGARLVVYDPALGRILFEAGPAYLETAGRLDVDRPAPGQQATTVEARDEDGRLVYTHGVTSRGARVTVIAPGQLDAMGLHIIAFDNDDLDVRDHLGRLIFSRQTRPDGTLVERQGPGHGCACVRTTSPTGMARVTPL